MFMSPFFLYFLFFCLFAKVMGVIIKITIRCSRTSTPFRVPSLFLISSKGVKRRGSRIQNKPDDDGLLVGDSVSWFSLELGHPHDHQSLSRVSSMRQEWG
ncbi:hypothetical protein MLD38_012628 [Melastoma candidum]|uniref:Uncharacterized protein n=1 Tax=Melastoma candidum TaxID=119954 RepID=A0ACB9RA16_9MYRT|nr:hypothetical protein MLD38_012628 [Melastoma candidum]